MHVIPPTILQLHPLISQEELHSPINLVAIPIEKLNSKMLADYRSEWAAFFKHYSKGNAPERNVVLSKADELLSRYRDLFMI